MTKQYNRRKYTKKVRKTRRKHNKKTIRKHNKTSKKGGFWPFNTSSRNTTTPAVNSSCPDANVKCNFLDKQFQGKVNQTWNTCINMNGIYNHVLYITPNNVLIKSIETSQVPEFKVKLDTQPISCKIMIEDKYVSCFLFICNEWYVMMRLWGKTINVGYFARTEANKAFYKLKNVEVDLDTKNPDNGSGIISFPTGKYNEVNNSIILSTSNTKVIQLNNDCFTNVNKSNNPNAFNVLQRFRQEKLFANYEKKEVAQEGVESIFSFFT